MKRRSIRQNNPRHRSPHSPATLLRIAIARRRRVASRAVGGTRLRAPSPGDPIMIVDTLLTRAAALLLLCNASVAALAEVPTFRISQVFSNLDGSVQFIELTEYAGRDG